MAHQTTKLELPLKAASAISQYVPVSFLAGASALSETVIRTGSLNEDALGISLATAASPGDPVAVQVHGVAKCYAAASLGAGARVAIGSTNGRLIPLLASGVGTVIGNLTTALTRYIVGTALKNAADGDVFPVFLDRGQII